MNFFPVPLRSLLVRAMFVASLLLQLTPLRAQEDLSGGTLILSGGSISSGGTLSLGTSTFGLYNNQVVLTQQLTINSGTLVTAPPAILEPIGSTLEFTNTSPTSTIETTDGSLTIAGSLLKTGSGSVIIATNTSFHLSTNATLNISGNNTLSLSNSSIGSGTLLLTAGTFSRITTTLAPVSINVGAGASLTSIPTVVNFLTGGSVRFLGGSLSLDSNVSLLYLPAIANLASNPLDLHLGNHVEGEKFVLQLSYNPTLAAGLGDLNDLYLGWFDPVANVWKNAIAANSDGGVSSRFVQGAYNSATDFNLGTYGVDTTNNVVWAVIDHNSTFGVANSELDPPAPAPEPTTAALLIFGGCAMLLRRRHRAA